MVRLVLFGICLLWCCVGCRSTHVSQVAEGGELSGNWSFVYYEAMDSDGDAMPAPPFDTLRFISGNQVYLRRVLQGAPVRCSYFLRKKELGIRLPVPGYRSTVLVKCQAYLAEGGRILVLRDRGTGAVYVRTEELLEIENHLIGDWASKPMADGKQERMTISHGGGILFRGSGLRGEYRLWNSESGLMISAFLYVPDRGIRTVVWRVENESDGDIRMVPYGPSGVLRRRAISWHRYVRPIGSLK